MNLDLCVFWVSSLAYPNSLGTKSYVVVVVDTLGFKALETWQNMSSNHDCRDVEHINCNIFLIIKRMAIPTL